MRRKRGSPCNVQLESRENRLARVSKSALQGRKGSAKPRRLVLIDIQARQRHASHFTLKFSLPVGRGLKRMSGVSRLDIEF